MLRQIQDDANYLKKLISPLTSDDVLITIDGVELQGAESEAALADIKAYNSAKLNRLELILESGIIPDEYISINKKTYYPSEEELKRKETQSLPKHSFFCTKKKRKMNGFKNSQIKLFRDDGSQITHFFMEHKKNGQYPKGSYAAKVKQGSLRDRNGPPKYAVKIYHQHMFNGDTMHELRLAMRSAYCYKQLGREGYAFRMNGKQCLVTKWLKGVNLDEADQGEVQSMPIARRIIMAISLLRELNILHKQGLIYHDIKPTNVMINFGKLCFVDLDSVSPKNEKPLFGNAPMHTPQFLPTAQMAFDAAYSSKAYLQFNEKTDFYALGITLAHLFQEIYEPRRKILITPVINKGSMQTFQHISFSLHHGLQYSAHPALQKFLKRMVFQKKQKLNNCEDYINALKEILIIYPDYKKYLDEDRLINLGKDIAANDGKKAFMEIEIELLGFNQRLNSVEKQMQLRA